MARLSGHVGPARIDELKLLASEVVTNSVRHGRVGSEGWVSINYTLDGSRLRVEVRDSGEQGTPLARAPDYERGGGFGLFLVAQLASAWGVVREPRVCVWFELPRC